MNSNLQKLAIWVAVLVLLAALFNLFNNPAQSRRAGEVAYSEFLANVESGQVTEVELAGNRINGTLRDSATMCAFCQRGQQFCGPFAHSPPGTAIAGRPDPLASAASESARL